MFIIHDSYVGTATKMGQRPSDRLCSYTRLELFGIDTRRCLCQESLRDQDLDNWIRCTCGSKSKVGPHSWFVFHKCFFYQCTPTFFVPFFDPKPCCSSLFWIWSSLLPSLHSECCPKDSKQTWDHPMIPKQCLM